MIDNDKIKFLQLEMIDILDSFHKICQKNGLRYYLVFGTLLGAIRHKGFIPWDPDIDVAMMRDDYEKLRDVFENNNIEGFYLEHYKNEKNHISPHYVLRKNGTYIDYYKDEDLKFIPSHKGIYIDIFPLDEAPIDKNEQIKHDRRIRRISRIIVLKYAPTYGEKTSQCKKIAKRVVQILMTPFSFERLNTKLNQVMQMYNGSNSGLIACCGAIGFYKQCLFEQSVYGTPREVEFEGKIFYAPSKAELFLTKRYGNYLELPPEAERYTYFECIKDVGRNK